MTDRQLRSVCTTTLAIFLCTKISPGGISTIWLAGTRLSEQPIHKNSGFCCFDNEEKNSGSLALMDEAHARFFSSNSFNVFISNQPQCQFRGVGVCLA